MVLIDDFKIKSNFKNIIDKKKYKNIQIDYRYSYYEKYKEEIDFKPVNINKDYKRIMKEYDIIFSLCSQIFPKQLVNAVCCINFHFGILPYACGVLPIAFSIANNIPVGVTVHLMNEKIDNGDIIYQEKVEVLSTDRYKDIEIKCQDKLIDILENHIDDLINGNYKAVKQTNNRKYFSLKDFNNLCNIDLKEKLTAQEFINKLKALELNDGSKAFYISDNGEKIYISISLSKKVNI